MASASRVASGVTKGLPSRSPPIQEPKLTSWGISARAGFHSILRGKGGGDLRVEDGQGVEDGGLVVVERHANLVAHGGTHVAHVVGLPQRRDLSDDFLLQCIEAGLGDGDAVDLHEQVGDSAALEHDRAASDLSGVRGEYWGDADALEQGASLVRGDPSELHLPKRAAQRPSLGFGRGVKLAGKTAALAVVGLGQVDELEVEGEGAGEMVGGGQAERLYTAQRVLQRVGGGGRTGLGRGGPGDRAAPGAAVPASSASRRAMAVWRSSSTASKTGRPACSRSTSPSSMPSERTSRRRGASLSSPVGACSSARR